MSASTRSTLLLPLLGVAVGVGLAFLVSRNGADIRGQALPPPAGSEGASCGFSLPACDAGLVCSGFDPFIGPGTCKKAIYCCAFQAPLVNGACKIANAGHSTPEMACPSNPDGTLLAFEGDATCGGLASGGGQPCGFCGDGKVDPGEQCDDGNANNNDACSTSCINQDIYCCSDGSGDYQKGTCINKNLGQCILDTDIYATTVITRDDVGSDMGLDACITECERFSESEEPGGCGDGIVFGDEECDDGNVDEGDGCDYDCKIEKGHCCKASYGGGFLVCSTFSNSESEDWCIGPKRYDLSNETCSNECVGGIFNSSSSSSSPAWCCNTTSYTCNPIGTPGSGVSF